MKIDNSDEYYYFDQFQFIGIGEIGKKVFRHPSLQDEEILKRCYIYDKDKFDKRMNTFIFESGCVGLCVVVQSGNKKDYLRFQEIAMMFSYKVIMCIVITPSKREYTNQASAFFLKHTDLLLVVPSHQKSFNAIDRSVQLVKEIGATVYNKAKLFCIDIIDFCNFIKSTGTANFGWIQVKTGDNLAERIIEQVDIKQMEKAQKLLFTFNHFDNFLMRDLERLDHYFRNIVGKDGSLFFQASELLTKEDACTLFWIATDFKKANRASDLEPLPHFSND